jgi:adenylate cyclase
MAPKHVRHAARLSSEAAEAKYGSTLAREVTTWACSACGGANPAGMRFCGHCGAPDVAPAQPDEPDEQNVTDALRSFVTSAVADRLVEAGGQLPEERRLITALFADVSGFTALAERLDPEQLLEVIDPVISGLSSIVGRYEGYVEKFAGDALLALFGAPVSHEDDAERALLVALEMHEELARICDRLPHDPELSVHIGVNSGHGIARVLGSEARMDYAVLGDSVILAQRLESAAPSGETYVSDSTRQLASARFDFESVGELTLKGKAEPVPAWRLLGKRTSDQPQRARRLIGRDRELATGQAAIDALMQGRGGVLTVTGEAGVGKSHLTEEIGRHAAASSARWLQTRCLSYGSALPYWPFAELLRTHALDASTNPFFARLLGVAGDALGELEPEAFRRGLHDAFRAWLRDTADDAPTIVVVEDVHWADASSIALLGDVVHLSAESPLLLYLVARPESEEVLDGLVPARHAIRLEPLAADDLEALLAGLLGTTAPSGLARFVAARTGGNPFFAEELVRSLLEGGTLVLQDGSWRMGAGWDERRVPSTIEEVLSARIDSLPRSAASVLQTASVIGRRVGFDLLRAVHEPASDVDEAIVRLVDAGMLDHDSDERVDQVVFHHALVQDVAYSRLLRRRQRAIHGRVAEVAEQLFGSGDDVIDLLARHLYLAEAGEKAVGYLLRAASRAKQLFANDEAILHFSRAAKLAPNDAEIKLELADLHELVGNYAEALDLYSGVRDASGDVRAWRGIAATLRKQGEYAKALEVVDDAFVAGDFEKDALLPLWLEQGWTLSVAGRFEQAIDVLEVGLAAAGERSDAVVGHLLLQLARAKTVDGRVTEALEHGIGARQLFEQHGDLRGLATVCRILGDTYRRSDDLDSAAAALREGLALAERVGSAEEIGGCLINLALVEMRRGALADAIAYNRKAIEEFERFGNASGRAQGYANLAWALAQNGDLGESLVYCERALDLAQTIGHSLTIADVYDTMALVRLKEGDVTRAIEQAEEAAALYLEMGAAPQAADSLELAAKAWEFIGENERARATRARAREHSASAAQL